MSQALQAVAVADKVMAKAREALSRMQMEMDMAQWPDDLRAIMWDAIALEASSRSDAARNK
jgi:hypothetical protein